MQKLDFRSDISSQVIPGAQTKCFLYIFIPKRAGVQEETLKRYSKCVAGHLSATTGVSPGFAEISLNNSEESLCNEVAFFCKSNP